MRGQAKLPAVEDRLLVHATNVTGLGASQVVSAMIEALEKSPLARSLDCYLPVVGPLAAMRFSAEQIRFHSFRRRLPNSVSRAFECAFSSLYFPPYRYGITLGDIPIRTVAEQVVLVHQSHLISPSIDADSTHQLGMRIMRWLFRRNAPYAKHFVVQSEVMKAGLESSYPEIAGRIAVVPQPPPLWLRQQPRSAPIASGPGLTLFYPAAAYPHKNHRIIQGMGERMPQPSGRFQQLVLTLQSDEEQRLGIDLPWVKNVGRLNPSECLATYHRVDGLFFPSVAESYGLPLVEAMTLGLPVLCSDRPFARWLCGAEAIYFDPTDPQDAWRAVAELERRLEGEWRPDWSQALAKLPPSWSAVGDSFLELLGVAS